jgi:hypothetical protein
VNNEVVSAATGIVRLASADDDDAIEQQVGWVVERHGDDGLMLLVRTLAYLSAAATEEIADIRGKTVSEILTAFEDTVPDLDGGDGDD